MRKPITQKAKSPLKQVKSAGELVNKTTTTTPGDITEVEVDGSISAPKATGGKQTADADSYINGLKKRFPKATGQDLVDKGYISSSYADRFPSSFSAKTTVQGPDKVETKEQPLYTRDKTDAIAPYQQYQNRVNERGARNELASSGRKNLNALAKRYARETDDGGKKGLGQFMSNRKQKRDFRRGLVAEGRTDVANAARDDRDRVSETFLDRSYAEEGLERARNQYAQGASGDDAVISKPRVADQTDLNRADVSAQRDILEGKTDVKSPAEMSNGRNVGITNRGPLKKGYFKGK